MRTHLHNQDGRVCVFPTPKWNDPTSVNATCPIGAAPYLAGEDVL